MRVVKVLLDVGDKCEECRYSKNVNIGGYCGLYLKWLEKAREECNKCEIKRDEEYERLYL